MGYYKWTEGKLISATSCCGNTQQPEFSVCKGVSVKCLCDKLWITKGKCYYRAIYMCLYSPGNNIVELADGRKRIWRRFCANHSGRKTWNAIHKCYTRTICHTEKQNFNFIALTSPYFSVHGNQQGIYFKN